MSAPFTGEAGHTYGFYSVATDNVGRREPDKTKPDATTAVQVPYPGALPIPPNEVATTASGLAYSRVSQTFNGSVTLRNLSASAIRGPLQILFTGLTPGVTLVNATSHLAGAPYLTVPALASLAPGQSVTISVQFKNPSNALINFTPAIYSGSF
jgi:hypothetical protein